MVSGIIGAYLVEKGLLTQEQLKDVMYEQKKTRAKLGLIAVARGMLTQQDADRINRAQAKCDKRFGDLALEMGLLDQAQVDELLSTQGNAYMSFAQTMEDMSLLNISQLEQCLLDLRDEMHLSDEDITALKSDEVEKILPLFMPEGAEMYLGISGVLLRTIIRLVDKDAYPEKAAFVSRHPTDHAAVQFANGTDSLMVGLSGNDGSLLPLACIFGKDEFQMPDEDAMDAVAEFVNCVTGLYASEVSMNDVELELMPPEYAAPLTEALADQMLILPLYVGGRKIYFLSAFNGKIILQ